MKKTLVIAMAAVLVLSMAVYAEKAKTTIPIIADGAITVDGALGEWSKAGVSPIMLDKASMVTHGKVEWLGKGKQDAKVYVAFAEEGVYFAAEVTNPKGIYNNAPGKDMWNGNAVELFIGFDNSDPSREMYTESDYQIGFSPGKIKKDGKVENPAEIYCFNQQVTITDGKIKAVKTKTGYIVEAFVPASFFAAWTLTKGMEIGFDISMDDVTKGAARNVQLTWSGYVDSWKNPAGWGVAIVK